MPSLASGSSLGDPGLVLSPTTLRRYTGQTIPVGAFSDQLPKTPLRDSAAALG